MDTLASLLLFSTLLQRVTSVALPEISLQAVLETVSWESRIFSGEGVRLRCSVPDGHRSSWNFEWFKGSKRASQSGPDFVLWNAHIKDSGKYYCRGVRGTAVGNIKTLLSKPVEINVDGGFAILQAPAHPGLVGHTLTLTCRVRFNPPLHQVILYKDGVAVMTQNGPSPRVELTHLTLEDQGQYSCRASWNHNRVTRSVASLDTPVQVLEVLGQPILEVKPVDNQWLRLHCHLQYNAPDPAPPVNYYFYKDGMRLGPATSEESELVPYGPGAYSCRAKVPVRGIARWSQPTSFGQAAGHVPMQIPRFLQPQGFQPPVSSLPPAPERPRLSPTTLPLSHTASEHTEEEFEDLPESTQPAVTSAAWNAAGRSGDQSLVPHQDDKSG